MIIPTCLFYKCQANVKYLVTLLFSTANPGPATFEKQPVFLPALHTQHAVAVLPVVVGASGGLKPHVLRMYEDVLQRRPGHVLIICSHHRYL